ncbi:hypothetical protein [Proteus faecis]|uniref:hypothetical protein n=1 Tax=Proteus faecis TaxID=2050967 RepID=UPI003075D622
MGKRRDSSSYLYHWVKCEDKGISEHQKIARAIRVLANILCDTFLRSGESIEAKFGCSSICFTESPLDFIIDDKSKYQPVGIRFYKKDILRLGGLPVIYASEEDSKLLPSQFIWRYVRFEPLSVSESRPYGIDFTWEREWRVDREKISLLDDEVFLCSDYATFESIIVPSDYFRDKLIHYMERVFCRERAKYGDNSLEFHEDYIELVSSKILVIT